MNETIQGRQTLSQNDLGAIRELEELCNSSDGIRLKLNWDVLISRQPGNMNDFLYFDDSGKLLGYIAIYYFGGPEAEISGMVHPSCRRTGIFSKLLDYAALECRKRSIGSLLFINDRNSLSGASFARSAGSVFDHSEHRMELPGSMNPLNATFPVKLRRAGVADIDMLTKLNAMCFNVDEEEARSYLAEMAPGEGEDRNGAPEVYVSVLDGRDIGTLRLNWENADLMIYGFGLLPEFRGKGYGRATLATVVNLSLSRKPAHVGLEVDCVNDTALSLYKSCGFNTIATYDYYRLAI